MRSSQTLCFSWAASFHSHIKDLRQEQQKNHPVHRSVHSEMVIVQATRIWLVTQQQKTDTKTYIRNNSWYSPIALAKNLALLRFFTSVRTPKGSPGRCTDILASTLNWPSEKREKWQFFRNSEAAWSFKDKRVSRQAISNFPCCLVTAT